MTYCNESMRDCQGVWQEVSIIAGGIRELPTRLEQLDSCIPLPGAETFKQAMLNTAHLGSDVCETIAARHNWTWPRAAAEEVIRMIADN